MTDDVDEGATRRAVVCPHCFNGVKERAGGVARCGTCEGFVRPELVDEEPRSWPVVDTIGTLLMLPAMWLVTAVMRWRDER